jgi:hypothetical protein
MGQALNRRLHAIELGDFDDFGRALAPHEDPPSQLSFHLMYLTRSEMRLKTCVDDDVKFVFGWSSEIDHALYGLPLPVASSPEALIRQLRACYRALIEERIVGDRREGLYLVLLNDRWAQRVEAAGGRVFPTADDDNYIYSTSKLGTLEGASLRRHREMVRAFERHNRELAIEPLTADRIEDVRWLIRSWLERKLEQSRTRPPDSPDYFHLLRDDVSSAILALEHLGDLPIRGKIYYLDKEPVGFISGIPFSEDTFLYLHHKNLPIKGLAEVIYSDFSRSLIGEFEFVNAAQDLGIPSLRAFKRRLSPVRMLKTHRAFVPSAALLESTSR